jgi:hypothetical protein
LHYPGCTSAHIHGAAGRTVRRNPYNQKKALRAYQDLQRAKIAMRKNMAALTKLGSSGPSATKTKRLEKLVKENIAIDKRLQKYNDDYQKNLY